MRYDRVTAPFVLEGQMNGEIFKAYVGQSLAPTLKRDGIVFMANVSVRKVAGLEETIEARGAIRFYLPAYSPDFNIIEQLFATLKALLRKVAAYTLKNAAFTVLSAPSSFHAEKNNGSDASELRRRCAWVHHGSGPRPTGYAGKKIKGKKRHILVPTLPAASIK